MLGTGQLSIYHTLDVTTLTGVLLNPNQRPSVHREALSAMAKVSPEERRARVAQVIRNVIQFPTRYNQEVMAQAIDLLATDPAVQATETMLHLLPEIARSMLGKDPLSDSFRDYFYITLMTRKRPEDREIWQKQLAHLDGETLAALLLDPLAEPVSAVVRPLQRIENLDKQHRGRALKLLLMRGISAGLPEPVMSAVRLMIRGG